MIGGFQVFSVSHSGMWARIRRVAAHPRIMSIQAVIFQYAKQLPSPSLISQSEPPPPSSKMPMEEDCSNPSAKQIAKKDPLIFVINPFLMHDGTVAWLAGSANDAEDMKRHNRDVYDGAERNTQSLLDFDGFINLLDIKLSYPKAARFANSCSINTTTSNTSGCVDGVTC